MNEERKAEPTMSEEEIKNAVALAGCVLQKASHVETLGVLSRGLLYFRSELERAREREREVSVRLERLEALADAVRRWAIHSNPSVIQQKEEIVLEKLAALGRDQ